MDAAAANLAQSCLVELLLEQAADHALLLIDPHGKVISWLMASERVFGYTTDEMIGSGIDRLYTLEDRRRNVPAAEMEIALKSGRSENDRWMQRKDGLRFWAVGALVALREKDGQLAGFAKLLRDRTEIKGQIDALERRAESNAQESGRKSMVLGTLAHELRNPLGVLSNVAILMESLYPQDEKLAYAKRVLGRQTKYLTTLVEDLLEVSRIDAGKAELRIERVDLGRLLADALEASGAALRERSQKVELMQPQTPIVLDGDPTRLKQVFVNLIANASKYSEPERLILVRSSTEGEEAVVRVEDQGIGIPADLLPRIFDLFVQQDPVGKRGGGLGLGLSLVKEYVELHGGVVTVRSEGVGQGSEFVVRLPLRRGSAP